MSKYIPGLSYGLAVPSLYQQELNHRYGYSLREGAMENKLSDLLRGRGPSTSEGWLEIALLYEKLRYSRGSIDYALKMAERLEHDEVLERRKKGRYK